MASGADHDAIIEKIDIGGPAMVRAAAKNHGSVAVVTDIAQYDEVLKAIADGGFTVEQRRRLAAQAYAHTAAYDAAVSSWFAASYAPDEVAKETGWPDLVAQVWTRSDALRYGENPHQKAALYQAKSTAGSAGTSRVTLASPAPRCCMARPCPTTTTWTRTPRAARPSTSREPCVAIIKHSNPCGIAIGTNIAAAYAKALECDPLSAYGGVIAANSAVTDAMAEHILTSFAEVVIAPDFDPAAIEILTGKWKNIRLLRCVAARVGGGSAER